jgi:hypothetical protein
MAPSLAAKDWIDRVDSLQRNIDHDGFEVVFDGEDRRRRSFALGIRDLSALYVQGLGVQEILGADGADRQRVASRLDALGEQLSSCSNGSILFMASLPATELHPALQVIMSDGHGMLELGKRVVRRVLRRSAIRKNKLEKARMVASIRRLKRERRALQRVIARRDEQLRLVRHNARILNIPEHVIALICWYRELKFASRVSLDHGAVTGQDLGEGILDNLQGGE